MKSLLSRYCVFVVTSWLVLLTGCTDARRAYDQLELGKPVPKGNLLVRDGKSIQDGAVSAAASIWPVPVIASKDSVAIIVDKAGNVTGRKYESIALGYWGLFLTTSMARAIEVVVPEEYYREAPPGWTSLRSDDLIAQGAVPSTDPPPAPWARPQRAPANVQEYLIALRFPERPSEQAGLIPKFLGDCPLLGLPLFAIGMYSHNVDVRLADLCQFPACLTGITREGFDWAYTNPYGGTIRFRNLGGRRIRIDSSGLLFCDPFLLALYSPILIDATDHMYQAALARCTRLIREAPKDPTLYLRRAATYASMYDWDEALADCDAAARLAPKDAQVTQTAASLRAKVARFDDGAVSDLMWTRWRNDTSTSATHAGEFTFEWDKNPQRWVATYTRILQANPASPAAFNNRGASWYHMGRYQEALADFSRALELDGGCIDARLNRAHTYARLWRFTEAWKDLDACPDAAEGRHDEFLNYLRTWSPRAEHPRRPVPASRPVGPDGPLQ